MKSDENQFGGIFLTYLIILSFVLMPLYIFIKTDLSQGIYSLTCLPIGQTTHTITILTLWFSSMVYFERMKYLYPLTRLVTLMSILVIQIHLYDFIWSFQNWVFRRQPVNWVALVFVIISLSIILQIEKLHTIFRPVPRYVSFIGISLSILVGFLGMALTGFWGEMALVDSGILDIDPNQNVFWILSKIPSFFLMLPLIDNRDIAAPLRLDPRVLTW